ncbi:MAG: hypothetical protein KKI09_06415 [Spirochaetes bacterium]|nr:hypothetical protein [Spirochaetota bacterium]MBU0955045.1 hypothetical protein [Spirochaetota bacterium]
MTISRFFRHYLLSPLGVSVVLLSALLSAPIAIFNPLLLAIAVFPLIWLALSLLMLVTGIGGRSVLRERDRSRWEDKSETMFRLAADARRLSAMRLPDAGLKQLAGLAGLRAAEYHAACLKYRTHNPVATQAVAECLETLDAWLQQRNQEASDRHYGDLSAAAEDQQQSETGSASLVERTRALIEDRIAVITKASADISGSIPAADRLSIQEDL